MELQEYQQHAIRTLESNDQKHILTLGALGLAGEAGECVDIIKKHVFHNHALNQEKLKEELGDVLWYVAITAHALGVSLEQVAQTNMQKLFTRIQTVLIRPTALQEWTTTKNKTKKIKTEQFCSVFCFFTTQHQLLDAFFQVFGLQLRLLSQRRLPKFVLQWKDFVCNIHIFLSLVLACCS